MQRMMALLETGRSSSGGMPGGYAGGSVSSLIQKCNWKELLFIYLLFFLKALELRLPGKGRSLRRTRAGSWVKATITV